MEIHSPGGTGPRRFIGLRMRSRGGLGADVEPLERPGDAEEERQQLDEEQHPGRRRRRPARRSPTGSRPAPPSAAGMPSRGISRRSWRNMKSIVLPIIWKSNVVPTGIRTGYIRNSPLLSDIRSAVDRHAERGAGEHDRPGRRVQGREQGEEHELDGRQEQDAAGQFTSRHDRGSHGQRLEEIDVVEVAPERPGELHREDEGQVEDQGDRQPREDGHGRPGPAQPWARTRSRRRT